MKPVVFSAAVLTLPPMRGGPVWSGESSPALGSRSSSLFAWGTGLISPVPSRFFVAEWGGWRRGESPPTF